MSEEPQVLAGRYVLESLIAEGGMASVWRARDDVLARQVAVKILHPRLASDESFLERFRREALAAARLAHPNIISVFDTGVEGGETPKHYIVMEYCGGGTFEDILIDGPLEPARAVAMGTSICDALEFAHRAGVVHRDVKPANVLISEHSSLKVTDFGIAKAAFVSGDLTTTGSILGTMTYISPEQANGMDPDARSDLYALGVVMYRALVGRPPFKGDTEVATALKHLHEEPLPLRSVKAGIPRSLDTAVRRALAKDPDERYQSAGEMRDALNAAVGGPPNAGTQLIQRPRSPKPEASRPADAPVSFVSSEAKRIVPIVLLVLLAVGLVLLALNLTEEEPPERERTRNEQGSGGGSAGGEGESLKASATDFDPYSDDGEHPEEAPLAVDGDESTAWGTSSYETTLNVIKPGVGLLFDLGEPQEVGEVEIRLGTPGATFELRAGDSPGENETTFELIEKVGSAEAVSSLDTQGAKHRYWLVWITDLPGSGGGDASIAEVTFIAP